MTSRDLRRLSDEELVRRFVAHRARGDWASARPAWDQLVENVFDRIRTRVAVWRWPAHGVKVAPDDVDDVAQLAIIRLAGIMENFKGTVLPQFRAFALTCADHTCMDHARAQMNRERGLAGSLQDEPAEGVGRFDAELAVLAERDAARDAEIREAADVVASALPLVPSPEQRAVMQMSLEGVPVDEMAARLQTSAANVYQLRRRGLTKLKEVLAHGVG